MIPNDVDTTVHAPTGRLHLGLDVGTSGVRGVAVDDAGRVIAQAREPLPPTRREGARVTQDPRLWWHACERVLAGLGAQIDRGRVAAIAVDGTSGTLLLADAAGRPVSAGWMYDDASCIAEAARVASAAPTDSAARGSASPLARLLHLQAQHADAAHVLHQADWIAGRLAGRFDTADENNVLKLGYDVRARRWPDWLDALDVRRDTLPRVLPPGTPIGRLVPEWVRSLGLPAGVVVVAGTTDGVAAFLATGACEPGDAVTSLGTTLVVKLLSDRPVFEPRFGIYSHRLGDHWLPGGASNSGGGALLRHFSVERMAELTPSLRPDEPSGLDYYPLPATGERFPVSDAALPSRTEPRPADDARFFQALLEGVAAVERLAYDRIAELGAPGLRRVFSVGGGARNAGWTRLRERRLGVPLCTPVHEEAAVGAARLARQGADAAA